MSTKEKELPVATAKQKDLSKAADAFNDEQNGNGKGISVKDAFQMMKDADPGQLEELTSEYLTFEDDGIFHFIFDGMTTMETTQNNQPKTIEAVRLRDEDGKTLINGNAVLVSSCKRLTTIPCYIRVEVDGEKKSGNGNKYKNLKVHAFAGHTK